MNIMESKFGIEIPYQDYSLYQDFICEVNRLVDEDGCVSIYTNNNPYELEAVLLVETNANAEKIRELALKNKLKIVNTIEIYESLQNLCIGLKNIVILPYPLKQNNFLIKSLYINAFQIMDKSI